MSEGMKRGIRFGKGASHPVYPLVQISEEDMDDIKADRMRRSVTGYPAYYCLRGLALELYPTPHPDLDYEIILLGDYDR